MLECVVGVDKVRITRGVPDQYRYDVTGVHCTLVPLA